MNHRLRQLLLLPSFLCLDAPVVALGWALAVIFDSGTGSSDTLVKLVLLFFGMWAVYLADRIFDSYRLKNSDSLTGRHRFALRFRPLLWSILILTSVIAVTQLRRIEDVSHIYRGIVLAAATLSYFVVFRFSPKRWCGRIPGKELVISLCFSAGVMLTAGATQFSLANFLTATGLAALCLLNCLIISRSEADFDEKHDPQAYYSSRPRSAPPSWPGWVSGICGCLLFLIDGDLIIGSSLLVSSVVLYSLSRSIDDDSPSAQATADATLLIPWPIVIVIFLIF